MEKHRNFVIVLTADGSFEKAVPFNDKASIGEEVYFDKYIPKTRSRKIKIWRMRFISLCLIFTLGIFTMLYFTEEEETYAYVNIDINPSIELKVAKNMEIIDITPLNQDAEHIVSQLNKSEERDLQEVLTEILLSCDQLERKEILIGVSYTTDEKMGITNNIKEYFQTIDTDWQFIAFRLPGEVRELAVKNEISMNEEFATLIQSNQKELLDTIDIDEDKMDKIHSFYYTDAVPEESLQIEKLNKNEKY
nr:anti-sigma factor domain-containing protein [Oceanobacillus alkalisoli]